MRGKRGTGRRGLDGYDRSKDAAWEGRQERHAGQRQPAPHLALLGAGGGCWCGSVFGHDWPGKADGAPHPREGPLIDPDCRDGKHTSCTGAPCQCTSGPLGAHCGPGGDLS